MLAERSSPSRCSAQHFLGCHSGRDERPEAARRASKRHDGSEQRRCVFAAPNGHRSRGLAAGLGEIGIWRAKLVAIAHVARNSEAYRPNKMPRQGFPAIPEAIRGLNVERALIDGEAVVLRNDGRSDFGALLTKRGGA